MLATDKFQMGYTEEGNCKGQPNTALAPPQRLQWDLPEEVSPDHCRGAWVPPVPPGIGAGSVPLTGTPLYSPQTPSMAMG